MLTQGSPVWNARLSSGPVGQQHGRQRQLSAVHCGVAHLPVQVLRRGGPQDRLVGGAQRGVQARHAIARPLGAHAIADVVDHAHDQPAAVPPDRATVQLDDRAQAVAGGAGRPGGQAAGLDHFIVAARELLRVHQQQRVRGDLQQLFRAVVSDLVAGGAVHVDETHRLAIDDVDHVPGGVHGGAELQQLLLPALFVGHLAADAPVAAPGARRIAYRFAAHAKVPPRAVGIGPGDQLLAERRRGAAPAAGTGPAPVRARLETELPGRPSDPVPGDERVRADHGALETREAKRRVLFPVEIGDERDQARRRIRAVAVMNRHSGAPVAAPSRLRS
ncbi:MAG TPA: hypothetical protein VFA86_03875 [Gammaproteobacteria bacterium]|nr:hypothetical protein [Gammaproteobacteria bacterium]